MNKLSGPLSESVLTLIVTNEQEGAIASGLVSAELFSPPLDDIAARALEFRRKFKKPPGLAHLDDLFDHILSDPKSKRKHLYQAVLGGIIEQAKGLNAPYVLSRVNEFVQRQSLDAAILEAAERFQRGDEDSLADTQSILHKALKFKSSELDSGSFLSDAKRSLAFLDERSEIRYKLGIRELDHLGICPTVGRAFAFMAAKGRGKTWFCIEAAVKGMLQGARVVHISLEMSEDELNQRYMQRLFAVAKRPDKFEQTQFEFDELNRITGFKTVETSPRRHFQDPKIREKLLKKLNEWGTRFDRLVVKRFPTKGLSFSGLTAYLDGLELTNRFVPTMLILDYPKLMDLQTSAEFQRIGLGTMFERLRGLCVERNLAGVFPIQSNRQGERVKLITAEHTGEDYSQGQTADFTLTYNQTAREYEMGLARLFVDKARSDRDKFQVLISQSYNTGQFVTASAYMPNSYWSLVKDQEESEE